MTAGQGYAVQMKPFQVLTLEGEPVGDQRSALVSCYARMYTSDHAFGKLTSSRGDVVAKIGLTRSYPDDATCHHQTEIAKIKVAHGINWTCIRLIQRKRMDERSSQ